MAISKHLVSRPGPQPVDDFDLEITGEWEHSEPTPSDPDTPVEQRFLLRLRDNPEDLAMRMVYADWLEERDQAHKATFLRMLADEVDGMAARLRHAARGLPHEWLAIVSRAPIEKCAPQFQFKCPRSWEALAGTDDAKVRHCGTCARNVYFCIDLETVRMRGRAGDCVAFCASLVRDKALEEYDGDEVFMGEIASEPY